MLPYINIHTHRPTGRGIELRTAGIHPWEADSQDVEAFAARNSCRLTVEEAGEHWFHTPEQLAAVDRWQRESLRALG